MDEFLSSLFNLSIPGTVAGFSADKSTKPPPNFPITAAATSTTNHNNKSGDSLRHTKHLGLQQSRRAEEAEERKRNTYLHYHNATVWRTELDAIATGGWLHDSTISFWCEYLSVELLSLFPDIHHRLVVMSPELVQYLIASPDPIVPDDINNATHLLIPINDAMEAGTFYKHPGGHSAGSHWSLLVMTIGNNNDDGDGQHHCRQIMGHHLDSLSGLNEVAAHRALQVLADHLGRGAGSRAPHKTNTTPYFCNQLQNIPVPRQMNGSDCGVFVCLLMRHVVLRLLVAAAADARHVESYGEEKEEEARGCSSKKWLVGEQDHGVDLSLKEWTVDCAKGREQILSIVKGLRKRAVRRNDALWIP